MFNVERDLALFVNSTTTTSDGVPSILVTVCLHEIKRWVKSDQCPHVLSMLHALRPN